MKKPSLLISIPAYNEAHNIGQLLDDIRNQVNENYNLTSVVVYSDCSTDDTVKIVRSYKNLPIKLIDGKKRRGKAYLVNHIFRSAQTDIVVQLDADVRMRNNRFLSILIKPIVSGQADLTSAKIMEIDPQNFIQRALFASMHYKKNLFESINGGNNIYTCHGRARGFSKKLYSQIEFPMSTSEDAYSYLFALSRGCTYSYVSDVKIYYALPSTFHDHILQSARFFDQGEHISKYFTPELLKRERNIPLGKSLLSMLDFFIHKPLYATLYICLAAYCYIYSFFTTRHPNTWKVSKSSKKNITIK